MTADDDGRPGPSFQGFHDYADDTPRSHGTAADFDRTAIWSRPPIAYIPEPDPPPGAWDDIPGDPESRAGGRPWGKIATVGGIVVALAAGLWLGLGADRPEDAALVRAAAEAPLSAPAPALNVEVARPQLAAAPPPPAPAERLEVLPAARPGTTPPPPVRTPPAVAQVPPAVEQAAAPAQPRPSPKSPTAPGAPRETAAAAPTGDPVPAASGVAPSFACRDAPSRARAMVCADPGLARLDRRMKRAYADALGAGVNETVLQDDQADWTDIREDAARYSRGAVANVYRQRIEELERMADEPH